MRLLILWVLAILTLSCQSSTQNAANSDNSNISKKDSTETQKNYQSDFPARMMNTEPVPPAAIQKYEPIFGKGIRLLRHHISFSKKQNEQIKTKADIKNLSEKEIKELFPDLFYQEFFTLLVFREERQLALVRNREIGGNEIIIMYSTKNKQPIIKEIHSKTLPETFLVQFAEKGKDDRMKLGEDISSAGLDENLTRKLTDAIRADFWLIQTTYSSS